MNDSLYMRMALDEAVRARDRGDYCFGAVVVSPTGEVVARGGNRVKSTNDSSRHVEVDVMRLAKSLTRDRYLTGYTLVTTCEPCIMCLGAAYWLGIRDVVYGAGQVDLATSCAALGYRPSPAAASVPGMQMRQVMRDECLGEMLSL